MNQDIDFKNWKANCLKTSPFLIISMLRNAKSFVGKRYFVVVIIPWLIKLLLSKQIPTVQCLLLASNHKFHFLLLDFVWVFFSIFTAFKAKRNCLEVCLYEYLTFYLISFSESKMDRKDKLFVINEVSLKSAVN